MSGKLQLVLPGLFDLPLSELAPDLLADKLPGLNRILRLANTQPNQAFTIDSVLQQVLNFPTPGESPAPGLPLAQACASSDIEKANRTLLFQAVHLQPDLHSAIIVPIQNNPDNLDDITLIINDLKDLFKVDFNIVSVADGLFLMTLNELEAPTHYPHILSVLGKPANPYIEQSRDNLNWYKLLNEIQMFMHQHPVNDERGRSGRLPLNSLWFWGGGGLPRQYDGDLAWCCDDPTLNRFAESLGLMTLGLGELTDLDASSDVVCIDLRLLELLKTGVATELDQLLLDIEAGLLTPLLSIVDQKRKRLWLRAGFEFDFELTPAARLKFWRRPRNLMNWDQQLREP
jgi:hypothetical protein